MVLIGIASLTSVAALNRTVEHAVHEYEELRIVENAIGHVARARTMLAERDAPESVIREFERAEARLDAFERLQSREEEAGETHQQAEQESLQAVRLRLAGVKAMTSFDQSGNAEAHFDLASEIDTLVSHLDALAVTTEVRETRREADDRTQAAQMTVTAAVAAVIGVSVIVSVIGYRSVVRPIQEFRQSTQRIAEGRLDERIGPQRDRELAELADDFNRMVQELHGLYRSLEEEIRRRSSELIRSERLAGVGFLAAGLAHEISTPLNIMTGYAELAQRAMERGTLDEAELRRTLHIVCEESYRCKSILQQLLSLSRRTESAMTLVPITAMAREVASVVSGLSQHRGKKLTVTADDGRAAIVVGNEVELKQVLFNLLMNAFDAVDEKEGHVQLRVEGRQDVVEVEIRDNGCGMTPDVIECVFEPFFTARPRGQRRGFGLGLFVTHAIVQRHGGTISACSPGPGLGSTFVLWLPRAGTEIQGTPHHGQHSTAALQPSPRPDGRG